MTTFVKLSICQSLCSPSSLEEEKIVVDDYVSFKSHAQFKLHVQVIKFLREITYILLGFFQVKLLCCAYSMQLSNASQVVCELFSDRIGGKSGL